MPNFLWHRVAASRIVYKGELIILMVTVLQYSAGDFPLSFATESSATVYVCNSDGNFFKKRLARC